MKSIWRYSLFGLLAYLLFVAMILPADRVYALLQERNVVTLKLHQITGTVWQGSIAQVQIGHVNVKNLDWSLHPWSLLFGRLEISLRLNDLTGPVAVVVGRNFDGSYYIRHDDDALDVSALEQLMNPQPYGLTGNIMLDLDDIRIEEGQLVSISGDLQWQHAGLAAPLKLDAGNFDLALMTTDKIIKATLKDDGGPLQADGVFILSPDKSYRLTVSLRSKDKSRNDIKQALRMLGTPSPDGKVSLVRNGRLDLKRMFR